ncbi:MAG: YqeG family HAD IIIA-type phosphatase [Bacilli bacterium]|nr:YqeG family HAD IIIA-type phosphatase [Bacilli bacterium]
MKYMPSLIYPSIYEIDFNKLYASGKRIILSDLDNTIASYDELTPSEKQIMWNEDLRKLGFKIYLVSNNQDKRLIEFTKTFKVDGFIAKAKKPFTSKMEKYLNIHNINKEEVVALGDQLVTDISGFNKLGVTSILVKTINQKNQKWYTKINRIREKQILKNIKKEDFDKYNQIKVFYE